MIPLVGKRIGLCGQISRGGRRRGGPRAGGRDEEEAHDQAGGAGEVNVDHLLQRE